MPMDDEAPGPSTMAGRWTTSLPGRGAPAKSVPASRGLSPRSTGNSCGGSDAGDPAMWTAGVEHPGAMHIRYWGTRGSIATPGPSTVRYGGNTSCVELRSAGGTLVVFDCGTGARMLGRSLVEA